MSVTSTVIAGLNVWQFSGVVTDAEVKTVWASLIVNNAYRPGRFIYLAADADIRGVRGGFFCDLQAYGFILHSGRDRSKTALNNWVILQSVGLSVPDRSNFVREYDGSSVVPAVNGLDMNNGAMIYGVVGNPGGGDPRYLNEMIFGTLSNVLMTSQAFAETALEPKKMVGGVWKGIVMQKTDAFPILESVATKQVNYRCSINTESASNQPVVRIYNDSCQCLVSCTITRSGNALGTSRFSNTYASTGNAVIMVLNNYETDSYFGGRSDFSGRLANWHANNRIIGGVLKKIQTQPGALINVYDSRSASSPAKSTFSETTSDFLSGTTGTAADAITGNATFVVVGAIATGSIGAISRYTGQQYTLQKFGYRVQLQSVDMSTGDDDLSAFAPVPMTAQAGITRTQAQIAAATSIDTLQQLLEELHVLAVGLTGSASYSGAYAGNLFDYAGGALTTAFASATVDATASSKISFNAATNALTIKSATLAGTSALGSWVNTSGAITTAGGAAITAVVEDSTGVRVTVSKSGGGSFNISARKGTTGAYTNLGYQAGVSTVTYTVPKGTPIEIVAWALGHVTYTRLVDTSAGGVVLAMEMTPNAAINTALDVSAYLANITTTIDNSGAYPVFVVTANAPMTVPDIEYMKALVHRLVSSEIALSASFPPGSVSVLAINTDEIAINKPAIRIEVGAGVTTTQRVYMDAYFNRAPALALNPAWELAPVRADGNQVQILRTKPSLDPGYLAAKVVAAMPATPTTAEIAVAVRAEVEAAGGKLDTTMKSAKATKRQTL